MKSSKQELNDVRETLTKFWFLINSEENVGIYVTAAAHGHRLSQGYMKKVMPLNRKLKKFMGLK